MAAVVTARKQRASWFLAAGVVIVVAASLLAVQPAAADPVGDLQARARHIAEQLHTLQHQQEVASERANGATYQLTQLDAQLPAARAKAEQASALVRFNTALLSQWAVQAYVGQDGRDGVGQLFEADRDDAAMRLGYRRAVLGDRQQLVDDLSAAQADAHDALGSLQADEAAAKAAAEQAEAQRARLRQLVAQQASLQAQVQGQLVEAVAEQQAAIQAAAEQQAAAAAPVSGPAAAPVSGPATSAPQPTSSPGQQPAVSPPTTQRTSTTSPPKPAPPPSPAPGPAPPAPNGAGTAVAAAKSQVGKPYVWGGASPSAGFDCSGLTSWAWAQAGVSLPHFAQAQYDMTRRISSAALQPGDLVFYADSTGYVYHVAIYIGGGQVVQALNEKYGVMIGSLYSAGSAPYGYGRV